MILFLFLLLMLEKKNLLSSKRLFYLYRNTKQSFSPSFPYTHYTSFFKILYIYIYIRNVM